MKRVLLTFIAAALFALPPLTIHLRAAAGCTIHYEEALDDNGGTIAAVDTTAITPHGILVIVRTYAGGGAGTLSDSEINTWTDLAEQTEAVRAVRISYSIDPTTDASHTFTTTDQFSALLVLGCNADNAVAYDPTVTGASASPGTSLQPGSQTPDNNDSLIVTGIVVGNIDATTFSIDGSFTNYNLQSPGSNLAYDSALAWKILGTAAATNPTWSWTGSAFGNATMAVFSGFGAGGGPPPTSTGGLLLRGVGN